jgi:hypothetical protein
MRVHVLSLALACGGCAASNGGARPAFIAAAGEGAPTVAAGEVLVIGEFHGSREIPAAFLELVRRAGEGGRVVVGLELPPSTAQLGCGRDARLPPSWGTGMQDGRRSQAMRDLVCALRQGSTARRTEIVFLDEETRGDRFDEVAAARFRERLARRPAVGLILTGSFHARSAPGSLAANLRQAGTVVHSVVVSSPAAETWYCTDAGGCGAAAANVNFCSRFPEAGSASRWFAVPQASPAWDHCWSMPRLTPSPPAQG